MRGDGAPDPASEELRRVEDLKGLLSGFITTFLERASPPTCGRYRCIVDGADLASWKAGLLHVRERHRNEFNQLLSVLLYDKELDHMGFFFTKLFFPHLVYLPPAPPALNQEYPSALAPTFPRNPHQHVEPLSLESNPIALLTQQKMASLGARKAAATPQGTAKQGFRLTRSRYSVANKKRGLELRQMFTTNDIFKLDMDLFPTAERTVELPPIVSMAQAPPALPKAPKRKKKKESPSTITPVAPTTTPEPPVAPVKVKELQPKARPVKPEVAKAEERARAKAAHQALKDKQEEIETKKRQSEAEIVRLQEQKRNEEAALRVQAEQLRLRQKELKEAEKHEAARVARATLQADKLFAQMGEKMASELIEDVVCDLCNKLARRTHHESEKTRTRMAKEQLERKTEETRQAESKQRKKEEREVRRQFRNEEAERIWTGLANELVREECKYLAFDFVREHRHNLERERRAHAQALADAQAYQYLHGELDRTDLLPASYHPRGGIYGPGSLPPAATAAPPNTYQGGYSPYPPYPMYQPGPSYQSVVANVHAEGPSQAYYPRDVDERDEVPSYLAPSGGSASLPDHMGMPFGHTPSNYPPSRSSVPHYSQAPLPFQSTFSQAPPAFHLQRPYPLSGRAQETHHELPFLEEESSRPMSPGWLPGPISNGPPSGSFLHQPHSSFGMNQGSFTGTESFGSFGGPNGLGMSAEPPLPELGPEHFGYNPEFTVLLANLPQEMQYGDLHTLFHRVLAPEVSAQLKVSVFRVLLISFSFLLLTVGAGSAFCQRALLLH